MTEKDIKIILASNSPRRKELLQGLGIDFVVDTENSFEEKYSNDTPPQLIPTKMSEGKSFGFHRELSENEILITSDTMVVVDNEIFGKPKDIYDAKRMLKALSGKKHIVVTAFTLRDKFHHKTFNDATFVYFKELSDKEIEHYIERYNPFDKAGAYGIQDWIGYVGITKIEGSFFNVMGLPVHLLNTELQNFIKEKISLDN